MNRTNVPDSCVAFIIKSETSNYLQIRLDDVVTSYVLLY